MKIKRELIGALSFGTLFIFACAVVPLTERQQLIISSPREDAQLGQALYSQLVRQAGSRGQVLRRDESPQAERLHAMVRRVGGRIAKVASEHNDLKGVPWSYVILKSDTANAGALPGNRLIFWEGIFKVAPNEPSLAVIVGHEVAHVIARHGAERRAQSELANIAGSALLNAVAKGSPQAVNSTARIFGLTTQIGFALPFSRMHESEADKIGLILMAKAGYDPRQAFIVWERMSREKGPRPPELLSTHPNPETRIQDFQQWMPEALAYYEKVKNPEEIVVRSGEVY
jgi:predicted Zn-dependent protease